MYSVTKKYGHNAGLSACFRQWRAESHCRFMHGYALAFTLEFSSEELDSRNWVINFGGLKPVKQMLADTFDHITVIAVDDPELETFHALHNKGLIQLKIVEHVGCEAFAKLVFDWVNENIIACNEEFKQRSVELVKVTCHEHEGNAASHYRPLFGEAV